jgi:hypothetical protein
VTNGSDDERMRMLSTGPEFEHQNRAGYGTELTTEYRDEAVQAGPRRRSDADGVLGRLFPESAPTAPRSPAGRLLCAAAQIAAIGVGTVLLLLRIPGLPSWDTIYGEDYWEFFAQALQQPWHLFIAYNGYEQFVPRVLALFATYLPLAQVSKFLAVSGAVIACGCGLFIFYASAGYIRSAALRALLGTAVVLLPIAPMEIADSGVNTPWYLLLAMFWALLWRPRTRTGMAVAALVAFAAASSDSVCVLFIPLVAARLYVLRRPREHAVTAGWLAGCLVQVPEVVSGYLGGNSRLSQQSGSLGHSLAFYAHAVVLPSLGWHLDWRLQSLAGKNGATVIVAGILTAMVGAILLTQARNRPFVLTAVVAGFVFCVFGTTLTAHIATAAMSPDNESGARYTALPIFLLECVAVVGVDYVLRQRGSARGDARGAHGGAHRRPGVALRAAMAVSALVVVLAASWVFDFRYAGWRSFASWNWGPIAANWERACQQAPSGEINEVLPGPIDYTFRCDRIRP